MLSDEELLRYSRQILLKQVDIDGQLRLKQSRVLIVGLGGLGSPVALYLAAAGVGELHLADFDALDLTNLQRQTETRIEGLQAMLDAERAQREDVHRKETSTLVLRLILLLARTEAEGLFVWRSRRPPCSSCRRS